MLEIIATITLCKTHQVQRDLAKSKQLVINDNFISTYIYIYIYTGPSASKVD